MLVERDNIGIFGKMNSGKSTVMNLLTQQMTSIVDSTPGTTADTKIALQEIHGMGPVKLYDTAGIDELSVLGEKKRAKVFSDLKECDLVLLVIDPASSDFESERAIIDKARESDKQLFVIYNIFRDSDEAKITDVEETLDVLRFYRKIILNAADPKSRQPLLEFLLENFDSKNKKLELFPFLERDEYYILVIPMDVETPPGRYLRPQAMAEEYITRHWAYPISFRLDLSAARSSDSHMVASERSRFLGLIANSRKRPKAIITDSQAMDIMSQWVPDDIMLTTFSITMINYFSRGRLSEFAAGTHALQELKSGDKVLIVEACNHSRIGEDIGTVQIPKIFEKRYPGVIIEHNFGRAFQENKRLTDYKLIIHCGGCMISSQALTARLRDLETTGVPFTNYGVFLSFIQGEKALKKVLAPWGVQV